MYHFATDRVEAVRKLPPDLISLTCGHSLAGVPFLCARAGADGAVYVGTLEPVKGQPRAVEPLGSTQMERVCTSDGQPIRGFAAAVSQDGTVLVVDAHGSIWLTKAGQSSPSTAERLLPFSQLFWSPIGGDAVVEVACGGSHCLALTRAGKLLTWGSGGKGQLGHGGDGDEVSPRPVEMSNWRPNQRFITIAAGHAHSAATCDRFLLYTWGDGGDGRLGHDASEPRRRLVPTALASPHACEMAAGYVDTLLKPSDNWRMPACGERHSGGLTREGAVLTWGRGDWGRLGHGTPAVDVMRPRHVRELATEVITAIALGHAHTAAISQKGELWVWGTGAHGSPSWPWSLPGANKLFDPPEIFRMALPSRVEGVLFSSFVAASRDSLIFTAEELTPINSSAPYRPPTASVSARALVAAQAAVPSGTAAPSGRSAYAERAKKMRDAIASEPVLARRLAEEISRDASKAREDELRRGGRGVRRGVHMWHRALVLLAEQEPTLSRLAMKIERARDGQVSLTQSAYEKLTTTAWAVPDLSDSQNIALALGVPDATLLWTVESEMAVPRELLFDKPFRPAFNSECPRFRPPAQADELTPGPGAYLGLAKRMSEHVNSPRWGLPMDVAAPLNAHSRRVEPPKTGKLGHERDRYGPFIRGRTVNYIDLIQRENEARPGPARYELPDLMLRPMPRRIKPELKSRAPVKLIHDSFHLPTKGMIEYGGLRLGRSGRIAIPASARPVAETRSRYNGGSKGQSLGSSNPSCTSPTNRMPASAGATRSDPNVTPGGKVSLGSGSSTARARPRRDSMIAISASAPARGGRSPFVSARINSTSSRPQSARSVL